MQELDFLFHPHSVAIFGASTNPRKSGYRLVQNVINHHFQGKIYPINPKGGDILGLPVYQDLDEIVEKIDLAIIFVPNKFVVEIIKKCKRKGIKGAIIEAAGFEEVGEEGNKLRNEIIKITNNFQEFKIIGPNCTGITYIENNNQGFFSSFVPMPPIKAGSVAIISQSGFINGGFLLDTVTRYPNMGIRYVCSIGNKMNLDENDILEYILHDPKVTIISMYLESFSDARRLIKLTNQARTELNKKIIILRSGLSEIGAHATASHTGTLAQEKKQLINATLLQSHCIIAQDFRDLFELTHMQTYLESRKNNQRKNSNLGIITISGGAGAVMTDWCAYYNIPIPLLSSESYLQLKQIYPSWMNPNPNALIDIWPAVENASGDYQSIMLKTIKIVLSDPKIDAFIITAFYSQEAWRLDWDMVNKLLQEYQKPCFIWLFGVYDDVVKANDIFRKLNLPVYNSERTIIETYAKLVKNEIKE